MNLGAQMSRDPPEVQDKQRKPHDYMWCGSDASRAGVRAFSEFAFVLADSVSIGLVMHQVVFLSWPF